MQMKNYLLSSIFLGSLGSLGCAGEFNPDLSNLDTDTEVGTSEDPDGDSATSTSGAPTTSENPTGGSTTGSGGEPTMTASAGGTDSSDTGESVCGDGVVEGDEECDGTDLFEATCEDGDLYGGGQVGCSMDCSLDFAECEEMMYVQRFATGTMPLEVQLLGSVLPLLQDFTVSWQGQEQWGGGCLDNSPGNDWCMETGDIDDGQMSGFRIQLMFSAPGEVRFWTSRWTEKFDVFQFSIDGIVVEEKGGLHLAWEESVHQISTSGLHQFTWAYRKDASITEGADAIWIDAITVTNAEPV